MSRFNPTTIALIGGVLLLLLVGILFAGGRGSDQDKLGDNQLATTSGDKTSKACATTRTYDAIKRELFRQAAETRGSDQATFDRLASFAVVRMERPVLKSRDEAIGTMRCSGKLSLDLPPGVAVVGGRNTLTADIDYTLQPAADGSGDVVILEGADGIIVPLATLARSADGRKLPTVPAPSASDDTVAPSDGSEGRPPNVATPQPVQPPPATPQPPRATEPTPPPTASASPSFNCRYARTRGEISVCNDGGLASLDRQMANQYLRAVAGADAGERALLQRTRSRFLSYRDACRSDACIADAYRGRMTEIGDIMAGRWREPR